VQRRTMYGTGYLLRSNHLVVLSLASEANTGCLRGERVLAEKPGRSDSEEWSRLGPPFFTLFTFDRWPMCTAVRPCP